MLAGSVPLSAIGGVLESMRVSVLVSILGSVLESVLRAYLGAYSQAGWQCATECNFGGFLRGFSGVCLSAL